MNADLAAQLAPWALGLLVLVLLVLLVASRLKLAGERASRAVDRPADPEQARRLAAQYAGVSVETLDRIEALYADRPLPAPAPDPGPLTGDMMPCDQLVYPPGPPYGDAPEIRCTLPAGHWPRSHACVQGHRGAA